MSALAEEGAVREDTVGEGDLDLIYGPLRQQVTNSVHTQESLLANIQVCICLKIRTRVPHTIGGIHKHSGMYLFKSPSRVPPTIGGIHKHSGVYLLKNLSPGSSHHWRNSQAFRYVPA